MVKGFPGNRVEAYRAGITPNTLKAIGSWNYINRKNNQFYEWIIDPTEFSNIS
ncbi:MAG: hypothetical protein IPH45_04295 [Bacteroidales bacterium]|nr:hypothetical protein [Bacteroidales bacterium]